MRTAVEPVALNFIFRLTFANPTKTLIGTGPTVTVLKYNQRPAPDTYLYNIGRFINTSPGKYLCAASIQPHKSQGLIPSSIREQFTDLLDYLPGHDVGAIGVRLEIL